MANILTPFLNLVTLISESRGNRSFNIGKNPLSNVQWYNGTPSWISLSTPEDYEKAATENPVVKAAINLLASSASNGRKVARDIKTGDVIKWVDGNEAVKKAYKLLVQFPNPLQSAKEFEFQGIFYLKVFGNRYVYANMPMGFDKEIDILNVNSLVNLPSQFIDVKATGKLYDQTKISGIVSRYALNNTDPLRTFKPEEILHFNEVNITSEMASIMGVSKLQVLKYPITNTQLAFEAMNTLLKHRGPQYLLSPKKTDAMGAMQPLTDKEEKNVNEKLKETYGLSTNQRPFSISPIGIDAIKTTLNSQELGIYQEFSNNSIIIGNEFGVPPELIKTYIQGATYENQIQSVRRLYQDTTIPMVEDFDLYWTRRLNTEKHGFIIDTSWEHVPALQEDRKERAVAHNLVVKATVLPYEKNMITLNQALKMMDLPSVDNGDRYFWEYEKEQKPNNENNEEDGENEED